jgi:hypothetical protein
MDFGSMKEETSFDHLAKQERLIGLNSQVKYSIT